MRISYTIPPRRSDAPKVDLPKKENTTLVVSWIPERHHSDQAEVQLAMPTEGLPDLVDRGQKCEIFYTDLIV